MTRKTSWARRPAPAEIDPRFAPLPDAESAAPTQDAPTSSATGLSVQPQSAAAQSPAAKAFKRELARLDRLKKQLAEMQQQGQAYKVRKHQVLQPLLDQRLACMRQMALALDAWLDVKGLTKLQRETALGLVCHLSAELAQSGDAEMAALHDSRSPQTMADKRQLQADQMRDRVADMFEDLFGAAPPPELDGADPDAMMRAAMEKMQAMAAEQEARHQARTEARKAKRKPSAAQQQAEQAQQDADGLLRGIYRQLASALHPDREPDETERKRKNALMGEANAAYERKDLVTLLNLQLQAELVDPDHLERISDQRLQSLTLLLKRQVADLERERQIEQDRWWHELQLPHGFPLKAGQLDFMLQEQLDELNRVLLGMQADLETVVELATLKPWLTRQRQLTRQAKRRMGLDFPFPF